MKSNFLKSPAKINLFLKVGKRIKGKQHHNVQSLIFLTNLNDEIVIKRVKKSKDIIKFTGRFKKNIKRELPKLGDNSKKNRSRAMTSLLSEISRKENNR